MPQRDYCHDLFCFLCHSSSLSSSSMWKGFLPCCNIYSGFKWPKSALYCLFIPHPQLLVSIIVPILASRSTAIIEGFSSPLCQYSACKGSESWLSNRDSRDSFFPISMMMSFVVLNIMKMVSLQICYWLFRAFCWFFIDQVCYDTKIYVFIVNWQNGDTSWLVGRL